MFANDDLTQRSEEIIRSYTKQGYRVFKVQFKQYFPLFRASLDDLRLLFYVGTRCGEDAYEFALTYFEEWKHHPPERFGYRCNAYLYALSQSTSPKTVIEKPYLIPRFLETTGFVPGSYVYNPADERAPPSVT